MFQTCRIICTNMSYFLLGVFKMVMLRLTEKLRKIMQTIFYHYTMSSILFHTFLKGFSSVTTIQELLLTEEKASCLS